ncbi:MAG: transposase [Trueperaceae bacterium]|nr:transposase [Trueperaceae bacterium]
MDAAIVGIDLADDKQAVVITDHDARVLDRRMIRGNVWQAIAALPWAERVARDAGFKRIVLACEPTGSRWKPLLQHARDTGLELVCVNPMLVARGREGEDYTRERSDYRDGAVISRLTGERRCFVPYQPEGPWARLRHLGIHRDQQLQRASAARQGLRDLLTCYWPTALATAGDPMRSLTLRALLSVTADPAEVERLPVEELAARAKPLLARWGGRRLNHAILERLHACASEPGGVRAERAAAAERATLTAHDWLDASARQRDTEARMTSVLDELDLTRTVRTLPGLSLVGAATILAETGDPSRFTHARAWVKHAGLCPRANESGNYQGQTRISGRGRPRLRTAAWRVIWALVQHNHVYAARYTHLRTRTRNPLNDGQARTALSAALLRQLFVMLRTRAAWNPAIAAGREELLDAA